MEDIHEQLGVSKSYLNDTFAMIRIAKDGEVWVQYSDKLDIPTGIKAMRITAKVLRVIATESNDYG
ncbi:hypothetical protein WNA58_001545 [Vibrio cholerae]|uniref:Uncharacterized protein n=1 Tax=Vibrio alginolyticus TaxID=663 RepID=A0A7Y4EW64_VIBAL|nr:MULTISPECIES: hypothetical protein [Vibrio]EGQ7766325.1 hypothetical protein [Vibrio parahaemolyticus]EGR2181682.1 hypothetical protein [Vibrio parahaemolyticus]EHP3974289.1 hypothetical protein [Vibrio parahaemolyticus]EHR6002212.1 hypothetical protein [Vibrio parahaemolyticus]EID7759038.1 hypothetical protein [Vibrio parahaemolyticus]